MVWIVIIADLITYTVIIRSKFPWHFIINILLILLISNKHVHVQVFSNEVYFINDDDMYIVDDCLPII